VELRVHDGAPDAGGGEDADPFLVLDRPNPIGGEIVEDGLLDPAFRSFVGMYPTPARHGRPEPLHLNERTTAISIRTWERLRHRTPFGQKFDRKRSDRRSRSFNDL
jgi:hypothetical protein